MLLPWIFFLASLTILGQQGFAASVIRSNAFYARDDPIMTKRGDIPTLYAGHLEAIPDIPIAHQYPRPQDTYQYHSHPGFHEVSAQQLAKPFDETQFDNYEGDDAFDSHWYTENEDYEAQEMQDYPDHHLDGLKLGRKERMLDFIYDPKTKQTYPDSNSNPVNSSNPTVGSTSTADAVMGGTQASFLDGQHPQRKSMVKDKAILAGEVIGGCAAGGILGYGGYKAVQKSRRRH